MLWGILTFLMKCINKKCLPRTKNKPVPFLGTDRLLAPPGSKIKMKGISPPGTLFYTPLCFSVHRKACLATSQAPEKRHSFSLWKTACSSLLWQRGKSKWVISFIVINSSWNTDSVTSTICIMTECKEAVCGKVVKALWSNRMQVHLSVYAAALFLFCWEWGWLQVQIPVLSPLLRLGWLTEFGALQVKRNTQ